MPPKRQLPLTRASRSTSTQKAPLMPGAMLFYVAVLVVGAAMIARLFYLQVVRYDHFRAEAKAEQLKKFELPPTRGVISAHDGDNTLPMVLNERLYTVIADPVEVKNDHKTAVELSAILKTDSRDLEKRFAKTESRYEVVGTKVNEDLKNQIEKQKLLGIYVREKSYRTYPQGQLGAQTLGFVNDDNQGQYGLEGFMNDELSGKPGLLKAITDRDGVPLAASQGNVMTAPQNGKPVTLTIDLTMQRIAEEKLKAGLDRVSSKAGSVMIMDPNTGAIKAMASYPSYNPAEYSKVTDARLFNNPIVSDQLEPGSIMKPLLVGAALTSHSIDRNYSFIDQGSINVDGITIKNAEYWGIPNENLEGILQRSLNTGAVSILKQIGGGEINQTARDKWYDYLTNHYQLGKVTGVEQSAESAGSVTAPDKGNGLNVQYANMSFGQGIGVTLMQMAAAESSLINGGTYWQPHVVDAIDNKPVAPKMVKSDVVAPDVSQEIQSLMIQVANNNYRSALRKGYNVGGKTGTAEITGPDGKYYTDRFNGTFVGFVGGNKPQYLIIVEVKEPKIASSATAGLQAAAPVFGDVTQALMDSGAVLPSN